MACLGLEFQFHINREHYTDTYPLFLPQNRHETQANCNKKHCKIGHRLLLKTSKILHQKSIKVKLKNQLSNKIDNNYIRQNGMMHYVQSNQQMHYLHSMESLSYSLSLQSNNTIKQSNLISYNFTIVKIKEK